MYTFVCALLREKGPNSRYKYVDISRVRMAEIFDTYRDGVIELNNTTLTDNVYVTLEEIKTSTRYNYSNSYFSDWLVSQGNITITGTIKKPLLQSGQISFSDVFQAGFQVRRVNQADLNGVNTYPLDMMQDVYISKSVGEVSMLGDYTLPIVNGLAHLPIPTQSGLLVKGAGTTADITEDFHMGVISFENIGPIEFVPFTDSNIIIDESRFLRQGVFINLNKDLTNKSVILSFCGRLFLEHDMISVINKTGLIRVNLEKIDLLTFIHQTMPYLDLKTLGIDERIYTSGCLTKENISEDSAVYAMLRLLQSFVVIVDTPTLIYETVTATLPRATGYYEMFTPTKLPYVNDNGFLHPYWKITHPGYYNTTYRLHLKDTVHNSPLRQNGFDYPDDTRLNNHYSFEPRTNYHVGRLQNIIAEHLLIE